MAREVLIIDGNPAVGRGLRALLAGMPDVSVTGVAERGECALRQALTATPDVALVDADLAGLCGLALIRLLRVRLPRTRIVALGIYPERRWLALRAGAHAFVVKDAGFDALRAAIEALPTTNALPTSEAPSTGTQRTSMPASPADKVESRR